MDKKIEFSDEEIETPFEEICNSVLSFITDVDLNIKIKEALGVAPIELASLIIKNRKEEE